MCFAAKFEHFVMQLREKTPERDALTRSNFFEHAPECSLEPDRCRMAAKADGPRLICVMLRIKLREDFAHGVLR